MVKFIQKFEFFDFINKTVLGLGFERIANAKSFAGAQKYFSGDVGQIETTLKVLAGPDCQSKLIDELKLGFLNLDRIIQQINAEEFRSKANAFIGHWSFMAHFLLPQLSCLYSDIQPRLKSSSPLYYIPIYWPRLLQGWTPSKIVKNLLAERSSGNLEIKNLLNNIKPKSALTNKSINKLIREIKNEADFKRTTIDRALSLNETELKALLQTARYLQSVDNLLIKSFSRSQIVELYAFARHCVIYAKIVSPNETFCEALCLYPRSYIYWHQKLYFILKHDYYYPINSQDLSEMGIYKALINSMRISLSESPYEFLPINLINPSRSIINPVFHPWTKGKAIDKSEYPSTEAGMLMLQLGALFNHPHIDTATMLQQAEIYLRRFEADPDIKYHRHEINYYQALVYLLKEDLNMAKKFAEQSFNQCQKLTCGKTLGKITNLAILLKLIIEKPLNGGWTNKYYQNWLLSCPNRVLTRASLDSKNSQFEQCEIELFDLVNMVNRFNSANYTSINGKVIQYNPFVKLREILDKIVNHLQGDISEARLRRAIEKTVKGHDLNRPISQPLPFTFESALSNLSEAFLSYNFDLSETSGGLAWLLNLKPNKIDIIIDQLRKMRTTKQQKQHDEYVRKFRAFKAGSIVEIKIDKIIK